MTSFIFKYNSKSNHLDIVLHGSGAGIESEFIQKIVNSSTQAGHSVIAFNFPYMDSGKERNVANIEEELAALDKIIKFADGFNVQTIRLIGKSLGGVVASHYLVENNLKTEKYSLVVLGYVVGSMAAKHFPGQVKIIQGQKDKFGNIEQVKEDMKDAVSKDVIFIEIPNADHSYRNPDTMEPEYQDLAVEKAIT